MEDRDICPVPCLGFYIYTTDALRDESNNGLLLVSTKRSYRNICERTLGRWIKSCLTDVGIDTNIFSAHSTRGAAASKALRSGAPIDSILQTASWRSESVFSRFYNRQLNQQIDVESAIFRQDSSNQRIVFNFEITVKVEDMI